MHIWCVHTRYNTWEVGEDIEGERERATGSNFWPEIFICARLYMSSEVCTMHCELCTGKCRREDIEGERNRAAGFAPHFPSTPSLPPPVACLPAYRARQNLAHVIPTLNI